MAAKLAEIIDTFNMVDEEVRLELLLDYARKLPPLPPHLRRPGTRERYRVPECMTPVYMWVERDNGCVHIHVDVAEEAPTVKGFLSIIIAAYDGASPEELAAVPADLVHRLGLSDAIRMQRLVGISGIIGRLRRRGAELKTQPATGDEA